MANASVDDEIDEPTEDDFTNAFLNFSKDEYMVCDIVRRKQPNTRSAISLWLRSPSIAKPAIGAGQTKRKEFEEQSVLMLTRDFVTKPISNHGD